MDYFKFKWNDKQYSFLNHFIVHYKEQGNYFSMSVHDNMILDAQAKKIDENNQFVNNDEKYANENEKVSLHTFFEQSRIDNFYTNMYNFQLFSLQQRETIETDKISTFALFINEQLYLLIETGYDENYHIVKKLGNGEIINLSDENEFLHVLSYFFPIILYKGLDRIVFDGFDLLIILINKDTYCIFNGNQNFYVLREQESTIENDKYAFRYIKQDELSEQEKKEIQNVIKKERK